jgi:hypothetical protein
VADDAKGFMLADGFDDPVNDFGITFHLQWVGRAVLCPPLVRKTKTARTE